MPARSAEEKARRKKEFEERKAARRALKEEKLTNERLNGKGREEKSNETVNELCLTEDVYLKVGDKECHLVMLPEETMYLVLCYLPARDLGAVVMTCRTVNYALAECRISYLFSRLCNRKFGNSIVDQNSNYISHGSKNRMIKADIFMCAGLDDVRMLIEHSLKRGGNTGRLVTKKSKKSKGDADEFISYARFVEEAVSGNSILKSRSDTNEQILLPQTVNGRFASTSPEHTICRIGGDGSKSGAGGSGVASWGIGKRGQLGHGKRKDESQPRMLIGGIGYGIRIVQVSAGGGLVRVAHSLLLTEYGKVLSFGNAQYGQLGHGYSEGKQLSDTLRPRYIDSLADYTCTCVSAGELHSAVVTTDGDLYTWGDGFCGQLGHGDKRPQLLPMQVTEGDLGDECVLSVSCGNRHTISVTEDGDVFSFGLGHFGALGRSYTPYEYHTDSTIAGFENLDENDEDEENAFHDGPEVLLRPNPNNAIDDETRDRLNLLANLTLDDRSNQCIPMPIDSLHGIFIVGASAGHRHSLLLDSQGGVYSFGTGSGGALGHGNRSKQQYPLKIMKFDNLDIHIIQISAGVDISMAVSSTGDVYAWGKTVGGRIGIPQQNSTGNDDVLVPTLVSLDDANGVKVKAIDVECGYVHSLIVGLDGTIHICGGVGIDGNDDGQQRVDGDLQKGLPSQVRDFNIWHRLKEPSEKTKIVKWEKYGKYELKGRRKMMSEAEKWGI